MAKKKPTFIDLFAGAGGLSTGFKQAGYRHLLGIEVDSKMAETYEKNVGKVLVSDIKDVDGNKLPKTDVIIGGPPCQGFSAANRKVWNERKPDKRQNLIFEFARIVNENKPKAFVMENAPTLMGKRFKDSYLKKFEMLLEKNYDVRCQLVDLGKLGRIPQKRRRTICTGRRK